MMNMRSLKKWFCSLLILLSVFAGHTLAVEVQQGQLYPSGTQLESSGLGLSFKIPQGWQGAWPPGSELFILETLSPPATILVIIDQVDAAFLEKMMSQAIPLDTTLVLQPVSEISRQGSSLMADYAISGDKTKAAYVEARSGLGNLSVALVLVSEKQHIPALKNVTREFANSLSYQQPSTSTTSGSMNWQQYLKGRHLVRMYTGSGYSEEEHIYLCSNGAFYRTFNSGGFSAGSGVSGAFGGKGQGQWQAEGTTNGSGNFVLNYSNGEQAFFSVYFQGDKLYVNDRRWFRDNNDYCQ